MSSVIQYSSHDLAMSAHPQHAPRAQTLPPEKQQARQQAGAQRPPVVRAQSAREPLDASSAALLAAAIRADRAKAAESAPARAPLRATVRRAEGDGARASTDDSDERLRAQATNVALFRCKPLATTCRRSAPRPQRACAWFSERLMDAGDRRRLRRRRRALPRWTPTSTLLSRSCLKKPAKRREAPLQPAVHAVSPWLHTGEALRLHSADTLWLQPAEVLLCTGAHRLGGSLRGRQCVRL